MSDERIIPFYLDFISPYTWLALMDSERFAREHGIRWEPRPIVFAALLDAHGLVGPAETKAKRRYTVQDVVRCAAELGVRFSGPPEHPFRSIEALRTLQLMKDEPEAMRLATALSDACWGEGRSLTDPSVLGDVVRGLGLDAHDLERRIAQPTVKLGLRQATEAAIERGVFGVPTFVVDGELFWGHDRMDQLARRLAGAAPPADAMIARVLSRRRGADRRGLPKMDD